ncbi:MAG: SIR2 family protein [Pseudomonadales bacterium]|nr:SIR2 family protein [Pseudomonadales bacterium]
MNQQGLTDLFSSRPQNFAWFLGAGASRSSGLPTADDVIWYMKRRYYCSQENQEISRHDIQNPRVREIIQSYMDSKGFPEKWSDEEYTTYFEKIFGDDRERQRRFINAILKEDNLRLSIGNRVFGALIAMDLIKVAFTTNFDSVVEKAVAEVSGKSIAAYHLEGSQSINSAFNNEEFPIYCKLHGDFRYESIKNLSVDLATQNKDLANCLINSCNRFGFIVAGYSGRDKSIMDLFYQVLESNNPFPNGLYWLGVKGFEAPPTVKRLLTAAQKKGINADYIQIETFDAFLLRLWRNIDNKPHDISSKVQKTDCSKIDLQLPEPGDGIPLLRLNALPVTKHPTSCIELEFRETTERDSIRQVEHNYMDSVITSRTRPYYCWGKEQLVQKGFGTLCNNIQRVDIPSKFSISEGEFLKGFYEDALSRALSKGLPLLSRYSRHTAWLIADPHAEDKTKLNPLFDIVGKESGDILGLYTEATEVFPNSQQVSWSEGLKLSIDVKGGRMWVLIEPDIWVWPIRARRLAVQFLDDRKSDRYNNKYNQLLDAWIGILFDDQAEIKVTPFKDGDPDENPIFVLHKRTAYSKRSRV